MNAIDMYHSGIIFHKPTKFQPIPCNYHGVVGLTKNVLWTDIHNPKTMCLVELARGYPNCQPVNKSSYYTIN